MKTARDAENLRGGAGRSGAGAGAAPAAESTGRAAPPNARGAGARSVGSRAPKIGLADFSSERLKLGLLACARQQRPLAVRVYLKAPKRRPADEGEWGALVGSGSRGNMRIESRRGDSREASDGNSSTLRKKKSAA